MQPASAPSVVHHRPGLLAAKLREGRVIGIALGAAAVEGGGICSIERGAPAKALRQVRVGEELAAEGDQVRLALLQPRLGAVAVEAAGDDQRAAVCLAYQP